MVLTQGHTERWASSGRAPSEQKASGESAGLLWALSTPGCPPWRDVPGWCVGVQLYGCLTPPWGEQAVSARLFFPCTSKISAEETRQPGIYSSPVSSSSSVVPRLE